MKCFTSYTRYNPSTVCGEILTVTHRYTTFDTKEMDKFEEIIKSNVKSGIMAEFDLEGEDNNVSKRKYDYRL